jgi:transcriptional regulator with PAS, ATPase and Fis domain
VAGKRTFHALCQRGVDVNPAPADHGPRLPRIEQAKPGLVEVAEGGTLFIDEIGEMAPGLQAKLLRVLEDGHYRRVGGTQEVHADVRVVAATNRALEDEIKAGRFREDLFYRLNVVSIELTPLRERREDIPELVEHFLTTRQVGTRERVGPAGRPAGAARLPLAGQRPRAG